MVVLLFFFLLSCMALKVNSTKIAHGRQEKDGGKRTSPKGNRTTLQRKSGFQ